MKKNILEEVNSWPESLRELFEERAAIMEFEGGYSRELAEAMAYRDIKYDSNRLNP
jgi:hypothetical protein